MMLIDLITGVLAAIGLGGQIALAAGLFILVWYLRKTMKLGKLLGEITLTWVRILAAVLLILGVATALGWTYLEPSAFVDDVQEFVQLVLDEVVRRIQRRVEL